MSRIYVNEKGKGLVYFLKWKCVLDAIHRYAEERMDTLEADVGKELEVFWKQADECITSIKNIDVKPNQEVPIDEFEGFVTLQKQLFHMFIEEPRSGEKMYDEFDTILKDSENLFDINPTRMLKFLKLPARKQNDTTDSTVLSESTVPSEPMESTVPSEPIESTVAMESTVSSEFFRYFFWGSYAMLVLFVFAVIIAL